MPRKLKVFETHIGFYDMLVAAPSMKAAAEAWHATPKLFAQGFAKQAQDPDTVEMALAQPGMVLKRPHGQSVPYSAEPVAPKAPRPSCAQKRRASAARKAQQVKLKVEKKAAMAAERQEKRQAAAELADIEEQEASLRQRRRMLQKKYHLRQI